MPKKFEHTRMVNVKRDREIRDLFRKLRNLYAPAVTRKFFEENYFLAEQSLYNIINRADHEPVDMMTCSIIYKTAMDPTFRL